MNGRLLFANSPPTQHMPLSVFIRVLFCSTVPSSLTTSWDYPEREQFTRLLLERATLPSIQAAKYRVEFRHKPGHAGRNLQSDSAEFFRRLNNPRSSDE
jgi:hypothetical protein